MSEWERIAAVNGGLYRSAETDRQSAQNAYDTEVSARLFYQDAVARVRALLDAEASECRTLSCSRCDLAFYVRAALDGPPSKENSA